ncbi:PTS lactose/cellobiose transporter subunit IIA [Paenibacillus pinistramenti]|uniref:PTS lactose/cellobiose transporter subunit IIA n=1 Tax=Paenibacillus pinistramenti TaxID=1768003 RepID=UPI001107BDF9|nr:PTS lactose/cellobiose transporter subunit IIA [Paenibacillus pinistramenti]
METSFEIILHAGNARSSAMEALTLAKEGKFDEAREKLAEAKKELHEAHHAQTKLIRAEAREESVDINVILIHAQDHLMTTIVVKDLITEFVDLYEKLAAA